MDAISFQSFGEWEDRRFLFSRVADDVGRREMSYDRRPTNRDYLVVTEFVRNVFPTQKMRSVFETEMAPAFFEFFELQRMRDVDVVGKYVKDVFRALDEPYRATSEQRERARNLCLSLANYCSAQKRKISPDGNM